MRTDRVTVLTYYFENSCQSAGKDSQEKKAQLDFDRQYTTQVKIRYFIRFLHAEQQSSEHRNLMLLCGLETIHQYDYPLWRHLHLQP